MSGSQFGRLAFGGGPYSRSAIQSVNLTLASNSRIVFGGELPPVNAGIALASRSSVAVAAHIMWAQIPAPPCAPWDDIDVPPCAPWQTIAVPPCAPWTLTAQCGCPSFTVWPQ